MTDDWFDSAMEDIETDEAAAEAVRWDPKPGEVIRLKFTKAEKVQSVKYNSTSYVVVGENLDKDNELTKVWASRSVLKNELLDAMPKLGTLMVIKFFGKVQNKAGDGEYFKYAVRAKEADVKLWHGITSGPISEPDPGPEPRKLDTADPAPDESPF